VVTVQKNNFRIVIPGFGELQAVKSTPISLPVQARGAQTIAWMAPENSLVKSGDIVIRLDGDPYRQRIQKEEFKVLKLDLEINEKKKQLEKEKSEVQGNLNITGIETELADVYAARDKRIYSRNKIIEDAINLDYLKVKKKHYQKQTLKLEQKARAHDAEVIFLDSHHSRLIPVPAATTVPN